MVIAAKDTPLLAARNPPCDRSRLGAVVRRHSTIGVAGLTNVAGQKKVAIQHRRSAFMSLASPPYWPCLLLSESSAMKNRIAHALSCAFLGLAALPAVAQSQAWICQLGTSSSDQALAAAPDGYGGVYVSGRTSGSLGGPNLGQDDAWLARYDGAGIQTWIRQFGTSYRDYATAAAPDGSGGVYLGGRTTGSLGAPNAGSDDAWLAHYDSAGNQAWVRQLGTTAVEWVAAAAPDGSGGVYVSGYTNGSLGGPGAGSDDAWLAHYDGAGNQTWIRQFGTLYGEWADGAASDGSGGVYVSGRTGAPLAGPQTGYYDAWVAHYDGAGNRAWIRQFGHAGSVDEAYAVAPDGSGGVYVSGTTTPWGSALSDAWIARYDSAGSQTWIHALGTSITNDVVYAAAPDASGGVFVTGFTNGALGGPHAGYADAWLARFDDMGSQTWIRQFGTSGSDSAIAAAPAGAASVYVTGSTTGNLGGPSAGSSDAWLSRYDLPCGTATSYCTAGTTTHGCVPSIAGAGNASASAGSGFTIAVTGVEGAQSGLLFYGLSGAVAFPWGASTSFMCVKSPLERTPVQNSGGTFGACDGVLSLDWNLYRASNPLSLGSPFAGGEIVRAQAWFRDPPSPKTTNLSNGLQFSVCP